MAKLLSASIFAPVTINGETKSVRDWSETLAIVKLNVTMDRIRRGWDPEKALTTPKIKISMEDYVEPPKPAKERKVIGYVWKFVRVSSSAGEYRKTPVFYTKTAEQKDVGNA